jgi:hypothetical protein
VWCTDVPREEEGQKVRYRIGFLMRVCCSGVHNCRAAV